MAANVRPYFVTYKGVRRLVEAVSPAAAVHHVVGADIGELRPARAAEVAQWYRAQFPVDVAGDDRRGLSAGVVLNPLPAFLAAPPRGPFGVDEARHWITQLRSTSIVEALARDKALVVFDQMHARGTMEMHDFEAIRQLCPRLFEAIISGQGEDMTRAAMESGESIDFQDVVTAIETYARRTRNGTAARAAPTPCFDLAGAMTAGAPVIDSQTDAKPGSAV